MLPRMLAATSDLWVSGEETSVLPGVEGEGKSAKEAEPDGGGKVFISQFPKETHGVRNLFQKKEVRTCMEWGKKSRGLLSHSSGRANAPFSRGV